MIRLPSVQKPYHTFFSEDDALIKRPDVPADDAADEAKAAYDKAVEEYVVKMRAARQTGDWSDIKVGAADPVKFLLRPMPFEGHAVITGMRERGANMEDIFLLACRLCLVEIEGVPVKVETEIHERFGKIATLSCFEKFGAALGLRIAYELGTVAIQRALADPL